MIFKYLCSKIRMIQRHRVLALYKRVLKCNAMLVPDMRQLGDVYTKVEFR